MNPFDKLRHELAVEKERRLWLEQDSAALKTLLCERAEQAEKALAEMRKCIEEEWDALINRALSIGKDQ